MPRQQTEAIEFGFHVFVVRLMVCTAVEKPFAASDEPPPKVIKRVSRKKSLQNGKKLSTGETENHMGTIFGRRPPMHDLIRLFVPTSLYQHDCAYHHKGSGQS